mgnify:CR=1 FL=1
MATFYFGDVSNIIIMAGVKYLEEVKGVDSGTPFSIGQCLCFISQTDLEYNDVNALQHPSPITHMVINITIELQLNCDVYDHVCDGTWMLERINIVIL